MNAADVQPMTAQGGQSVVVPPTTIEPTPVPTATPTESTMAEGGERPELSPKIHWLTLFIVGLTVVSLVLNIISNKKHIDRLEKDDADVDKKLKEHDLNLKRALGKKYESLA